MDGHSARLHFWMLMEMSQAYTGKNCVEAAEDLQGRNFSVQANMMLNDKVVPAMAEAFVKYSDYPAGRKSCGSFEGRTGSRG